jgi:hypothetical protein
MISDDLYEQCLPVLQAADPEDEDLQAEQLEDFIRKETDLNGKDLETTVLDALWRWRSKGKSGTHGTATPPPSRHTVIRRASPAPWQIARTPTPSQPSPRILHPSAALSVGSPAAMLRSKSSNNASPFTSPRASPRLAMASIIPHSPRLDAYQFSDSSPTRDTYADLGSDNVDWLVSDDGTSATSSMLGEGSLNGAAPEWVQPQTMDPYDILRSITGGARSNDELEKLLEENQYDLSSTIMALMEQPGADLQQPIPVPVAENERSVLVGKSMSPNARPVTPLGQQKTNVICKFWLASGHCARADCRFSHDSSTTICKYVYFHFESCSCRS